MQPRPKRISTEVEQALETHNKSMGKLNMVLDEELGKKIAVDELKSAIVAAVNAHHSSTTMCSECASLYIFLNRF